MMLNISFFIYHMTLQWILNNEVIHNYFIDATYVMLLLLLLLLLCGNFYKQLPCGQLNAFKLMSFYKYLIVTVSEGRWQNNKELNDNLKIEISHERTSKAIRC